MTLSPEARKEYSKKHYNENKLKYADSSKKQRQLRLEKLYALKNFPCVDCKGNFHPYAMDFDHVRGEKLGDVSDLINNRGWKYVLDEIEKCDLVCANCHRLRTWNRIYKS